MSHWSPKDRRGRLNNLLCGVDEPTKRQFKWDIEALWSMTNFKISEEICTQMKQLGLTRDATVTDITASVGGNTLKFAHHFKNVVAMEIDEKRYNMLDQNIKLFRLRNVKTFLGDFRDYIEEITTDAVMIDPPWGENYKTEAKLRIMMGAEELEDIVVGLLPRIKMMVVKLPLNYDIEYLESRIGAARIIGKKEFGSPNSMILLFINGDIGF